MKLTNEQLKALPEFNEYELEMLPTGETIRHRKIPKFAAYQQEDSDVAMFTDEKGKCWTVIYNCEGGPYKRRFFL